ATVVAQLLMNLRRIEQMQHLGDAGLVIAIALTGTGPGGPAEELEEIVGYLAIPELDGPGPRGYAAELLGHAGSLADHVKHDLGIDPFEGKAGVVLFVALIGVVGLAGKLVDS